MQIKIQLRWLQRSRAQFLCWAPGRIQVGHILLVGAQTWLWPLTTAALQDLYPPLYKRNLDNFGFVSVHAFTVKQPANKYLEKPLQDKMLAVQ